MVIDGKGNIFEDRRKTDRRKKESDGNVKEERRKKDRRKSEK